MHSDQAAFGGPWEVQTNEGLRTDVIPENVFPSGKVFFDHPWEEQYVRKYFPDICIVHNNWISGHDSKVERFKEYHLWGVENVLFPACERR